MSATATRTTIELTRSEILARLDTIARQRLGISAADFAMQYINGMLEDPGAVADLISLLYLLPEDDPLFEKAA